jgi:hypothetical protein
VTNDPAGKGAFARPQRAALPAAAVPASTRGKHIEIADLPGLTGPSHYPVRELVTALSAAGVPLTVPPWGSGGQSFAARAAERLRLNRTVTRHPRHAVLVPLMGPMSTCLFPYSLTKECVLFCWDVWAPDADAWARLLRRHRVGFAFMTARAAARQWRAQVPGLQTAWIAEAFDPPREFRGTPLERRRIHVLELGRRHAGYHAAVTPALVRADHVHLYEHVSGQVVFPTRDELAQGLLDTVVSVCFPSSITHPQRSGDVETLTRRYLESMAAGCIVLGSAPAELVDLYGYDPVVPVDWHDPTGQLLDILRHPGRHASLVARNYRRFLEVGTWSARIPQVLSTLRSWGFHW